METERVTHDVARGSNLDLILRGTNGAVNRLADALNHIAAAIVTPQGDQAKVDELTARLKASREILKTAEDNATQS